MSLTVVGSIAFDAVKTPYGERPRMLGGSAVHFSLAASFFDTVRVVGPVGEDWGEAEDAVLTGRGVDIEDIEHVPGGRTFFWSGVYGENLNDRETLATELGVFETFTPRLSPASAAADVLFLANIQPDLQRAVRAQAGSARFVALDSMNLWIDIARDSLVAAISEVDCLILNDAELRQLTGAPNLIGAAREVLGWGPRAVVAKQGEYGAALLTEEGFFSLPAFPLAEVQDPTGAGDTFAGGFVGYVAAHLAEAGTGADGEGGPAGGSDAGSAGAGRVDVDVLRRAMAYGTALASFNVQEFGTERVARLHGPEITERVGELAEMTRFEDRPVALRD